jgi:hypothetical protein
MPLAVLALTGASGCSWIVATTDATLRGDSKSTSFQFPDSRQYQACVRTPKGPCNPRPEQFIESVDLTLAQGTGTACSVSQVAHGVGVLRAHAGIKDPAIALEITDLRRTNAVARRALARDPSLQSASLGPEMQDLLAHGGTVPGAEPAMRALTSDTAQKMHAFYGAILGVPPVSGSDTTLRLTATEMRAYSDAIQVASANRSWRPVFFCSLARLQLAESRLRGAGDDLRAARDREVRALAAVADWSLYLDEYMNAYFRSGEFFDFALDPRTPKADLVKELKARLGLNDAEAKALADKIIAELGNGDLGKDGKLHLLTTLAGGFVTRGGKKIAFPDVDFTFTPFSENAFTVSKIDLVAVAADVIRVSIEAMGDSIAQLPGTKASTGCRSPHHLLDCYDPANYTVTAEQFASVNKDAAAAESMVGGITGKLIRGISWASLNNEAIARTVETALGVAARKAAEKLSWCFYACTDPASLRVRAGVPWDGETTIGFEFHP